MPDTTDVNPLLAKIAAALERLAPLPQTLPDFAAAAAFVWHSAPGGFQAVPKVNRVPLALLKGIDRTSSTLLDNTRRFAAGLPANNALLWGARGMGKSSLVKAAHAEACKSVPDLKLVEIHREDIATLPACLQYLKASPLRFIVFCDDLSFDKDDTSYKSLKAVLEGGIEGRPANVIFYATSNRRHLMPREMIDNERGTAINPAEVTEEKVSLSDRFGLWLGFHNASQDDYLAMVRAYAAHYQLNVTDADLQRDALEWSITRGARSGRVAWQFIIDLAGRQGVSL
jgi:predicted AAA+ superfamily ATPase